MQKQFSEYIENHQLIDKDQKVLLAVSGGPDSVVMIHLFHQAKIEFAIAHCNFHLRGKESDEDEQFVVQLSQRYAVPLFIEHFNTKKYAKENGISIQMAARDLRYKWFDEIRNANSFNFIATAHHADDAIETFFINTIRGTGIKGLHGILPKQGNIIHPLLFMTKDNIFNYCEDNKLAFRSDSSNDSDKYIRNKLRHHVIPIIKNIQPNFNSIMLDNFERINSQENLLQALVEKEFDKICNKQENKVTIDIDRLMQIPYPLEALRMYLSAYHFNFDTCSDVIYSLKNGQSGKQFLSPTHSLLRDRKELILISAERKEKFDTEIEISIDTLEIICPFPLKFRTTTNKPNEETLKNSNFAFLDKTKLKFPLILRKWRQGDKFKPYGMKGYKKISDYLIDKKINLIQKENTWVICSEEEIVWLVGHRIDDRFKIQNKNEEKFFIELSVD
ncbi:MAG: tRNA lysidine(34) synthetase TilS [Bacteroidales bacterium]